MQGQNDNSTKEPNDDAGLSHEKSSKSIFSEDEVQNIVKGFVSAWLKGEVKISFPSKDEQLATAKETKETIDGIEAARREAHYKIEFTNRIMLASSTGGATSEKQQEAVSLLFQDILLYRSSERIEGQFSESSVNERLQSLEQRANVTNEMVKQLVDMHKQELGL